MKTGRHSSMQSMAACIIIRGGPSGKGFSCPGDDIQDHQKWWGMTEMARRFQAVSHRLSLQAASFSPTCTLKHRSRPSAPILLASGITLADTSAILP